MTVTNKVSDLLIGTLLGDGNLQTNNGQTWRYRAIHKAIHAPYIMHKYEVLKDYCQSEPKYSSVFDERTQKSYYRYTFNTVFSDDFRFFGQLFYRENEEKKWKKHVPKNISKYLTDAALAYWYMDDGALKWKGRSNAVRLCTDSFSNEDVNVLLKALENKFQLKVSLQKKNGILRISILEESYPTLQKIITPFLLPCMYYKFPDGNNGVYEGEDISSDIHNVFQPRDL
jgi:LAGLIDADG DNA endonuclease family